MHTCAQLKEHATKAVSLEAIRLRLVLGFCPSVCFKMSTVNCHFRVKVKAVLSFFEKSHSSISTDT